MNTHAYILIYAATDIIALPLLTATYILYINYTVLMI